MFLQEDSVSPVVRKMFIQWPFINQYVLRKLHNISKFYTLYHIPKILGKDIEKDYEKTDRAKSHMGSLRSLVMMSEMQSYGK